MSVKPIDLSYEDLFNSHEHIMLLIRPDTGQIVSVNKKALAFYGYEEEIFLQMTIYDLSEICNEDKEEFMTLLLQKQNKCFYYPHKISNGRFKFVELHVSGLNINDESYLYFIIFDVTESTLQNNYFNMLFRHSPLGVVIADNDFKIVDINKSFSKVFQLTLDDIKYKSINEVMSFNKYSEDMNKSYNMGPTGNIFNQTVKLIKDNGQELDFELIKFPIMQYSYQIGYFIIYQNITAKVIYENKLRLLSKALAKNTEGILITNSEGKIEWINEAFSKITGFSDEELLGTNVRILAKRDKSKESYSEMEKKLIEDSQWEGESISKKKDGTTFHQSLKIYAMRDLKSNITHYTAIIADISQSKKLERELLHKSKLESIGTLAAGIAHEINTPIQFIGNNIAFINKGIVKLIDLVENYNKIIEKECEENSPIRAQLSELNKQAKLQFLVDEMPKAIEQSLEGVSRISTIVNAMKDFSHMGNNKFAYVDINKAVETTITITKNEWKYNANLESELENDLPLVECIIGDIKQVILNLIINAAHAINELKEIRQGKIIVKTYSNKESVFISVNDNGIGIKADIRDKIFDPFFTTKQVGVGTGQGLSMAYQTIVNKHKGRITFDTLAGEGTTFIIELPIVAKKEQIAL